MAKRTYGKNYECGFHFHRYYHFIYLLSGQGKISVGGELFQLRENTLYLTPKQVLHWYQAEDDGGIRTLEVKFAESSASLSSEIDDLPREIVDTDLNLKRFFHEVVSEGMSKKAHYEEMIDLKLAEMIFHLIRQQDKDHLSVPSNTFQKETENRQLKEAIVYMRENFASPLDLATLAEISCYDASYFCKLFRSELGTSPIHYLTRLRIDRAKELLMQPDMTVSEVAYAVGFQSIHYFSRCFRKWEKQSPNEYRQRYRDNVFLKLKHRGYILDGIVPEQQGDPMVAQR